MSEVPSVTILRGNPTPAEAEAVRAAVLKLWRESVAAAEDAGAEPGWVVAARAAGVRTRIVDVPGPHAWALSLRFDGGPVTTRRTGSGGAR